MQIDRGVTGRLPWAAVGAGPPVVVLAGLSPSTGVTGDAFVRSLLAPVRQLADSRRLIVFNRRAGLAIGPSMAELAAEHADAIRSQLRAPADVVGISTGGSIAQQLAADHPDLVERLVLLSSACRLGPVGRQLQNRVAAQLRAGHTRRAAGIAAAANVSWGLRTVARGIGWAMAARVITGPSAAADLAATIEAEDGFDLATCERKIRAKTLIVAGARDRFYGSELFRETAALIPDSQLLLLPKRGHLAVCRDRRALAHIAGFMTWPTTT